MEASISPFFLAVWRKTPQVKKNLPRVRLTDCRDFVGLYGHVAFNWNILVGFTRPRFNFRLLLPQTAGPK